MSCDEVLESIDRKLDEMRDRAAVFKQLELDDLDAAEDD